MGSDTSSKDDITTAVDSTHVLDDGNANKNEGICDCVNNINYFVIPSSRHVTTYSDNCDVIFRLKMSLEHCSVCMCVCLYHGERNIYNDAIVRLFALL